MQRNLIGKNNMSIQAFYEYVIIRDILAYTLPGSIILFGITIIVQALGTDRWNKLLPSFLAIDSVLVAITLALVAFVVGHVVDMVYRNLFQKGNWYRRPQTIRKMLTGSTTVRPEAEHDALAYEIREAVGQFLNINWQNTSIEQWMSSGKAFETNLLLGYWIEQEDPKLFSTEIGRPVVQAHFLHATGLAFICLGLCTTTAAAIHWLGLAHTPTPDQTAMILTIASSWLLGLLLIRQGGHKRDILVEHTFRVFYVMWRQRVLEKRIDPKTKHDATGKESL